MSEQNQAREIVSETVIRPVVRVEHSGRQQQSFLGGQQQEMGKGKLGPDRGGLYASR